MTRVVIVLRNKYVRGKQDERLHAFSLNQDKIQGLQYQRIKSRLLCYLFLFLVRVLDDAALAGGFFWNLPALLRDGLGAVNHLLSERRLLRPCQICTYRVTLPGLPQNLPRCLTQPLYPSQHFPWY